jgi:chemotaxis protein MotB
MSEEVKKVQDEDEGVQRDQEAWMDTLSDLIFLMITFFVLLISMSSMDVKSLKKAFGFFDDAAGVLMFPAPEEGNPSFVSKLTPLGEFMDSQKESSAQIISTSVFQDSAHKLLKGVADGLMSDKTGEELFSTLKPLAEKTGGAVKILKIKDGIEVLILGQLLFKDGSTTLNSEGRKLLEDVALILKLWGGDVEIVARWSWQQGPEILSQVIWVFEQKKISGKTIDPKLYPGIEREISFVLRKKE